jgi:DNA-directed RNA polymerase subunit H (RpoH/RPB5)
MTAVRKTCIEMIQQRGYIIEDDNSDECIILATKPSGERMCAILMDIHKFDVSRLKEYIGLMKELKVNHSIVVYKEKVTSKTKKTVENLDDIKIELFTDEELSFNITKNALVPVHRLLTREESKKFLIDYGTKFPVIRLSDPISRFYGYEKSDVIEIINSSGYISHCIVK